MEDKKQSIKEFFSYKFIVPSYQRGYKWGVEENGKDCAVKVLMKDLISAYNNKPKDKPSEYFLEAVTVVKDGKNMTLVDGQQRTTTLYLIFAVLGEFNLLKNTGIEYQVRKDSDDFLKQLIQLPLNNLLVNNPDDAQDIFYFKKALKVIQDELNNTPKDFSDFILKDVYLVVNEIHLEKAHSTFISLNGLKAVMKDEELIKSAILIKSSRPETKESETEKLGLEWKINEDRSRMARHWDKWLYWWNQQEVRAYFGINKHDYPLYFLLRTYWSLNDRTKKDFSFYNFKNEFISDSKNAKNNFEGLRKLQKSFEDLYDDWESFNSLGLIFKTTRTEQRQEALQYFLNMRGNKISMKEYAKWALVGATHLQITGDSEELRKEKTEKALNEITKLNEKEVYWDSETEKEFDDGRKESAFKFLLLLNLLEDNKLKRKFDFSIWHNRSLEHIYPKSKSIDLVFKNDLIEGSINCIGNLVLLYGRDNSSFGAKEFVEKKNTYFNLNSTEEFKSRHLLHTISIFAKEKWDAQTIVENKKNIVNILSKYYGLYF